MRCYRRLKTTMIIDAGEDDMRLKKINIKNFKGISSFTLQTNGGNTENLYGDNATGKTSIVDSVCWLLFDKDSQWKKKFQIKPIDADGNEIHNLETVVEGVFELADDAASIITLQKVFKEQYAKKRGSVTAEFTGHTTNYFIDGVPASKGDYTKRIADFANEELFKLLTSPTYFNTEMHWKDRRNVLIDVCGDITDMEIISSVIELNDLSIILDGKSVDDYRLVAMSRRKKINEELQQIPSKIEGANSVLPERVNTHIEVIVGKIVKLQEQAEVKRKEMATLTNGGMTAELNKQIAEIDTKVAEVKTKHQETVAVMTQDLRKELDAENEKVSRKMAELNPLKGSINGVIENINKLKKLHACNR